MRRNKNTRAKTRRRMTTDTNAFGPIIAIMLLGVVLGAVFVNFFSTDYLNSIKSYISGFISTFDKDSIDQKSTLINSLYKYVRVIAIIWISGFFPVGIGVIAGLLLIKFFAYGFTTSALVKYFGLKGFVIAGAAYMPQNLFILPAIVLIANSALKTIYKSDGNIKNIDLPEYSFVFLTGLTCCGVAAIIETFLTPLFILYI